MSDEADDVGRLPHRQHFAVTPEVGGTLRQRVFGQRLLHAGEVVAQDDVIGCLDFESTGGDSHKSMLRSDTFRP